MFKPIPGTVGSTRPLLKFLYPGLTSTFLHFVSCPSCIYTYVHSTLRLVHGISSHTDTLEMKSRNEFRQRCRIWIILLMTSNKVNHWVKQVAKSGLKRACPFSFSNIPIKMPQSLCFRKKVETLRKLDVWWQNFSPAPFSKDNCQIVTAHRPTQEVLLSFTKCSVHPIFNDVRAANWAGEPEKQS